MAIHPIEYRYYSDEMKSIFDEETKLQAWLDVESVWITSAYMAFLGFNVFYYQIQTHPWSQIHFIDTYLSR